MQLIIFNVRKDVHKQVSGSSIRIKGYTCYLKQLDVSYKFVAPSRPDYVDPQDFESFSCGLLLLLFVRVHNILNQIAVTKFTSLILKYFILKNSNIKKLAALSENTFILAHQNGSIPLFLKLAKGRKFIYDIHGILSLQREYLEDTSLRGKLAFYLSVTEEKYIYKYADIINATSERMIDFIKANFVTAAKFAVAPDGLLRDNLDEPVDLRRVELLTSQLGIHQNDKIIFFAGKFKKFGGVHVLIDAFCELAECIDNLKLLLIGSGQMEDYILKQIKTHKLEDRFVHIKQVNYSDLLYYQQLATLIICPDIENPYNELIPHVKVFDSVASGKPVVAAKFKVLEELFPPDACIIKYSNSSSVNDLKQTIIDSLNDLSWFRKADKKLLSEFTYRKLCKKLVQQYAQLIPQ
jgi:glycosyltransferase involved in cell wall biosynthesis